MFLKSRGQQLALQRPNITIKQEYNDLPFGQISLHGPASFFLSIWRDVLLVCLRETLWTANALGIYWDQVLLFGKRL